MHTRFDLDGFARSWLPANHLRSVLVYDTNGNKILRVGRYGNADCQGQGSLVPDPAPPGRSPEPPASGRTSTDGNAERSGADEATPGRSPDIGFCWVMAVGASDEALYAVDTGNQRTLRAKLSYAAEETVPVP